VAVIGAGPAGLESARLAAEAGHCVTLYEAADELGGQWRLAALAPGRGELALPLDWWRAELARFGVEVRLGERVDADRPPAADRIVWAVGARPAQTAVWRLRPFLKEGIPGAGALAHGRDLLAGRAKATGRVAVIDEEGGWPGVSLAAVLCDRRDVESVTWMASDPGFAAATAAISFETAALRWMTSAIDSGRLSIQPKKVIQVIERKYIVTAEDSGLGPFDAILLSTGTAANPWPDRPGSLAAGDCIAPRGLWSATSDALRVAAQIGS
jgi:hypothetical protein